MLNRNFKVADHPRGCGEKLETRAQPVMLMGSSPRVRGKGLVAVVGFFSWGIIPAGAGKSARRATSVVDAKDHPRGCGEKGTAPPGESMIRGSSPRVRGKGVRHRFKEHALGIIPAGAGKSFCDFPQSKAQGDHPRGCGEKSGRRRRCRCYRGSSPRVRGKVQSFAVPDGAPWIIPAGAGKSFCRAPRRRLLPDHPRGCGEKLRP